MTELIQTLIRPLWQFLMPVPMPWRSAIVLSLLIPILSWFFLRAFPWLIAQISQILLLVNLPHFVINLAQCFGSILLLPEYLITRYTRQRGFNIPLLIYLFDDIIIGIVNVIDQAGQLLYKILLKCSNILTYALKIRWLPHRNLLLILTSFFVVTWYIRPQINDNEATKSIDSGVTYWYSLEDWVIDGKLNSALLNNSSPKQFLRDYFSAINKQRYIVAWNSLSSEYKKNKSGSYRNFLNWWENKVEEVELHGVSVKLQDSTSATINVSMQYLIRDTRKKSQTELVRYHLIWDDQDNRWLINDSDYLHK